MDLIKREDAITAIKSIYNILGVTGTKVAVRILDMIPAAAAKPIELGVWKPYQTPLDSRQTGWICSNCSGVQFDLSNGDSPYCPLCGAYMELECET